MFYTSGTTGVPKGVTRHPPTPQHVASMSQMLLDVFGIKPGARVLISAPLYHAAPASYAVLAALNNAELWIEPRFDAERTLRLIETHRISHIYMVPTMFVRLLALPVEVRSHFDLTSLRFVATAGSPFPPELKRHMIEWWGPVIHEAYAASELGYITQIDSNEALRKPGSAGRPLTGVTLKVLSDNGVELRPGEVGLLYARNTSMPDFTYRKNDAARSSIEAHGLCTLGDMGYIDEDGFLFIVDRQSDMVISGGVNIYPAEIEAALITLSGVMDCAVFGIPDEEFGEAVAAVIQRAQGSEVTAQDVQTYLRERIADYKVPRRVIFSAELPRDENGKLYKRKLRESFWAGHARRV